jgi:hypothetical protein
MFQDGRRLDHWPRCSIGKIASGTGRFRFIAVSSAIAICFAVRKPTFIAGRAYRKPADLFGEGLSNKLRQQK